MPCSRAGPEAELDDDSSRVKGHSVHARILALMKDFSVATQSPLNLAKKLIQEQKRLLED